ncbi:sigma-70 family RNA polymerase sigma factor [Actinotalea sp. BY-33]|uniref:Sigma-70 family RNA polymerase sigma factor n=1 Tax=Actinotalea soli TaxID=2819234 RepID=A0A939LR76_9CELL|nr:sigma-70 family RNA polymerase sigma factor [Actinotalea soli]MBO1752579.1 sigma-70 family RNA polymerase sigma factor [Actinotalea soli]
MGAETDALLRRIHDEYADMLWRYVVRIPYDAELARDVVQEALLRAWKDGSILEKPDPVVRAWLVRVARNLVLDDLRSARHRREVADGVLPDRRQSDGGRSDGTQRLLDAWLVTDALATLTREHREVVVGAYYGGKTVATLAEELGIAPGTVKSRMHYGIRALRLALQERGVTA